MKSKGRWSRANALLLPARLEVCPGSFVLFHVHGFHNHNTSARHPLEERKATSNFLWTSSETQTSNPDSSRGRKRVWTHNKNYVPSCANSCLSRRTFKAKTFGEGTKKENGNYSCFRKLVWCPEPQLLPSRAHNQSAWPFPFSQGHKCWLFPLAPTYHSSPKMLLLFREVEDRTTRAQPQKKTCLIFPHPQSFSHSFVYPVTG